MSDFFRQGSEWLLNDLRRQIDRGSNRTHTRLKNDLGRVTNVRKVSGSKAEQFMSQRNTYQRYASPSSNPHKDEGPDTYYVDGIEITWIKR